MPQKFINKASLLFNTVFLLVFVLAEFFGFNLITPVKAAACNYQVVFFGTDKQSYGIYDTVKFHVKLQISGDMSQCTDRVYFQYYLKTKTNSKYYLGRDIVSLVGVVAERNFDDSGAFTVSLDKIDLVSTVPDPSNVVFILDVFGLINSSTSVLTNQQNTQLSIKVSGASIPGGGYPLTLTVGPVPDPATGTYIAAAGKTIKVWLQMKPEDVQTLTDNVDIFTTVNGNSYGKMEGVDKARLKNLADVYQEISLNPSGPLKTGQNDIAVKVTYTGQASTLVAGASVAIQGGSGFTNGGGKKYTCDAAQKKCIETTDGSGTDLATCQSSCSGGGNCSSNNDCANGLQVCRNSKCVFVSCSSDQDCTGSGEKCDINDTGYCYHQTTGGTCTPACTAGYTCQNGGCVQTSGGGANDQLYNPLPTDSLVATFLSIVRAFVVILAVFAVLFVMIGGFQMVMASGNEELYTKARKTITWAILGLVVALLSFSIIAIVQNLLKANINYPT